MNVAKSIALLYHDFVSSGDPRTKDWVGVSTPWLTFGSMAVYLLLITKVLPWWMKDREPFKLRGLLIVYNSFLSIYSLVTFLMIGFNGWFYKVDYRCFPNDFSISPENTTTLNLIWMFWVSKFIELLDTVYFVLRKKDRQVTGLHVYHHCTMIFNVWITIKLCAVGHFNFIGLSNSFVHFPMYAYYGLSAVGPHMQKYLKWKKYITKIQLIQFVLNIFHGTQVLFNKCDVSQALAYISVFQSFVFLVLFLNFYIKAYVKTGEKIMSVKLSKHEDCNVKDSDSNGNLKSYCNWPTVNGYENATLANGNHSYTVHNRVLSNESSCNSTEPSSSPKRLRNRPRKD